MENKNDKMAVGRRGVLFMIAGVVVMIVGFILLSGGGVKDPQVFNWSMFDFRRLVAAPITIVAGIIVVAIGIMHKEK